MPNCQLSHQTSILTQTPMEELGEIISVEADPNDTIENVKKKIQECENIPANQQRLTFTGTVLPDHTRLCTMRENDLLHLSINGLSQEKIMKPTKAGGHLYEDVSVVAQTAMVLNGNDYIPTWVENVGAAVAGHTYRRVQISTGGQTSGTVKVLNGDRIGGSDFFSTV